MAAKNTHSVWKQLGQSDPYFGVLSHPRFRAAATDGPARSEFFSSGEEYVSRVLGVVHQLFPDFEPRRGLDFGCGVGRLALPLARRIAELWAVDVSPAMIEEARRNCAEAGLGNVALRVSDGDAVGPLEGSFDFIHSFIVFQHIPVRAGLRLFGQLLELLADGGVGVIHFPYANTNPLWRRALYEICKWMPGAHAALNAVRGRKQAPFMQMNCYPLDRLLLMLQSGGCHRVSLRFVDHQGYAGALLFFRRIRESAY